LALYTALVFTLFLRYGQQFQSQYDQHLYPFLPIFALWIVVFYIANLYEPRLLRNNVFFFSSLFQAIAIATGISVLFFYLLPAYVITPKTNLAIFVAIFLGLAFLLRYSFNDLLKKKLKKLVLIVGANAQALELAKFIKENPQLGYTLAYVVDIDPNTVDEAENELEKFGIIQGVGNISHVIKDRDIDTVVLSPEAYKSPEVIEIFYKTLGKKINFYNLSSLYEQLTGKVPLGAIDQIWFLENLNEGSKKFFELTKRAGDIVLALALSVPTLVLFPFLALLIKTTSPGPLIYSQKRAGRLGKDFEIKKFRSMHKDAEKETGAVWAAENDARITKIGKFLRKTRLDELPQVWNILKGEMSFVGPRAERPEFNEQLKHVPFYEERYLVKPGLSGWAQINFRYGASVSDAEEKLKYDLYYIKNRSLILDLGIILKTIRIMLQQAGK
ncbi:MAG: sugar transferase, partial [Candidatus Colwellbacteria bacterium]